jgi:hypothetical protein
MNLKNQLKNLLRKVKNKINKLWKDLIGIYLKVKHSKLSDYNYYQNLCKEFKDNFLKN